jgi:hypothetical protein
MLSRILDFIRMLVQRCTLEQHRLIIPISVTKPLFQADSFSVGQSQQNYRALVDTGAQRSVLSHSVIAQQKLIRTGHMQFAGIHGPQTHSRYLAGIGLWAKRVDNHNQMSRFQDAELSLFTIEQPFEVVDMQDNANFDLIIGFDVLKSFSFSFDHASQTFELIAAK